MIKLRNLIKESQIEEAQIESVPVMFRGKEYFVHKGNLEDNTMSKLFLFQDPKLDRVVKGSKGVMLIRKSDIESKLKEEGAVNEGGSTIGGIELDDSLLNADRDWFAKNSSKFAIGVRRLLAGSKLVVPNAYSRPNLITISINE